MLSARVNLDTPIDSNNSSNSNNTAKIDDENKKIINSNISSSSVVKSTNTAINKRASSSTPSSPSTSSSLSSNVVNSASNKASGVRRLKQLVALTSPIKQQQQQQRKANADNNNNNSSENVNSQLSIPTVVVQQQQQQQQLQLQETSSCCQFVINPSSQVYCRWSLIVSCAFLYNFWSLSYRFAFKEIDANSFVFWFALDYFADAIYALDVVINFHTGFVNKSGVLERNLHKIAAHYKECTLFYLDCFCLLPLDILYLSIGYNSILRITRLVKIYKFWAYVDRTERHTNYPNVFRTCTLVHYILVIFHWNACILYMLTKSNLLDVSHLFASTTTTTSTTLTTLTTTAVSRSQQQQQHQQQQQQVNVECGDFCQYVRAFYWASLALTTVGHFPRPTSTTEFVYVTFELLFGLFLFAAVLGHVADIVTNVSSARKEFQAKLDSVKTFMRTRRVSDELQSKVVRWFDYLWTSRKSSDEETSVGCLPDRLKAELAIHVHLDTLKRVDIFQNTDAGFLCELVLRLKQVLFSPGDYVCRKDEVGHEMYIVSRGLLQVVADEGKTVVATLKAGSYFGEISVLNVGTAGNKRTASVRSVGYSDLFCLNKKDLWDVLKDYPNAELRIRAKAEQRLSKLDIKQRKGSCLQQQQQQQTTTTTNNNSIINSKSSNSYINNYNKTSDFPSVINTTATNNNNSLQLPISKQQQQPPTQVESGVAGKLRSRRSRRVVRCAGESALASNCNCVAAGLLCARQALPLAGVCCATALSASACIACAPPPPPPLTALSQRPQCLHATQSYWQDFSLMSASNNATAQHNHNHQTLARNQSARRLTTNDDNNNNNNDNNNEQQQRRFSSSASLPALQQQQQHQLNSSSTRNNDNDDESCVRIDIARFS